MRFSDLATVINERCPGSVVEQQPNSLVVTRESLVCVARLLKSDEMAFEQLHCVTAVDRRDHMEVVYIFCSVSKHRNLMLKVRLPSDDLTTGTLCGLWKSANWLEREVYDLFGIRFLDHPDLRRIMNPDSWSDFPLRKDFARPDFIKKPETKGLKG